ncbi:jg8466 [Pararge aegeria aegeria]|uniref:Jg8466 protein n=1 Tax=Pararge aegeria aegeria TaxID=348720 RepID=A0A8S4RWA2_9NEOP|nr:jg8466 [Pararge aegeria aegeria]
MRRWPSLAFTTLNIKLRQYINYKQTYEASTSSTSGQNPAIRALGPRRCEHLCILCQMCIAVPCDYLLLDLSCDLAALIRMVQIDLLSLKGTANLENLNIGDVNSEDIKSIVKKHQILLRAQKPSYLSALGFSNLSLVMFSKVASTSWSYLSLLNQMSENFDV